MFTHDMPTRIRCATRCPRERSVVQTEEASPYSVSFASAIGLVLGVERDECGHRPEDLLAHRPVGIGQPGPERRLDPRPAVEIGAERRHAAADQGLRAALLGQPVVARAPCRDARARSAAQWSWRRRRGGRGAGRGRAATSPSATRRRSAAGRTPARCTGTPARCWRTPTGSVRPACRRDRRRRRRSPRSCRRARRTPGAPAARPRAMMPAPVADEPGEGDAVDAGMVDEELAGRIGAEAVHDVVDAGRQADLVEHLGQQRRRRRASLRSVSRPRRCRRPAPARPSRSAATAAGSTARSRRRRRAACARRSSAPAVRRAGRS